MEGHLVVMYRGSFYNTLEGPRCILVRYFFDDPKKEGNLVFAFNALGNGFGELVRLLPN